MDTWGPPFWYVLHTSAEQLGKSKLAIVQTDEVNRWILLLKSVEGALPCDMCRKHYKAWLAAHPVVQFQGLKGEALRLRAREWLWRLHEDVNQRKGVVSGITMEMLPGMYTLTNYQARVEELVKCLKEGVLLGRAQAEATFTFRKHLHYLRKLTDSI